MNDRREFPLGCKTKGEVVTKQRLAGFHVWEENHSVGVGAEPSHFFKGEK